MTTHFLIFPMVLNDKDLETLKTITKQLTEFNYQKLTMLRNCRQNIIYYLAKAIIALQDVIKAKNTSGYRWTSYNLNMILLKLEFINELMKKENPTLLKEEIETVSIILRDIKLMLDLGYEESKVELYTVG